MHVGEQQRVRDGRARVVVDAVRPAVDGGVFPIKRVVDERVEVEADLLVDGHDAVRAVVLHRPPGAASWEEVAMEPVGNDVFRAAFRARGPGLHAYAVQAWVQPFLTWQRDLAKRVQAQQDLRVDLQVGALLVAHAAERGGGPDATWLHQVAALLPDPARQPEAVSAALGVDLLHAVLSRDERLQATRSPEFQVLVERERACFGAWYEFFPRSCSPDPARPGTLADARRRLADVAALGFDVVYLPPIHPIGQVHRKGRNNAPRAEPGDVGSPWAIGSAAGGHAAVHPELGTLEDFRALLREARAQGLEVAMDVAFQCAPDHPWVREHPEWFLHRPDGTIQYAENPPKKYQDIVPFHFQGPAWESLWAALRDVVLAWAEEGVRIFRVDNPHTKPFPFWDWLLAQVRERFPDAVFLAEAFTRPKLMYRLAKGGFSQSYNYFPWRTSKAELVAYFTELTRSAVKESFRAALWPNTPDILPELLQTGGRAAFLQRLVLAATLGATYGIYGPPFELLEGTPREPGSEEYQDSEKYQVRHWDLHAPGNLRTEVARLNAIRRDNPALHRDGSLEFHPIDNDALLAFSKHSAEADNTILVVVNLDPFHVHRGWLQLPLASWGLDQEPRYQVHDLLQGRRFLWSGPRNYVELNPAECPAHVFRLRRRLRTERDFEYFS